MLDDVERRPPRLNIGLESGARLDTRPLAPQPGEPGREMAGHARNSADPWRRGVPGGEQRFDPLRFACERAVRCEIRAKPIARRPVVPARSFGGPYDGGSGAIESIEENLDSRAARRPGRPKRFGAPARDCGESPFDVLAGAEPIHPIIDAIAGIGEAVEIADFNIVAAAARRFGAERAEIRLVRFGRLDGEDFGPPAPAP
jgi:hypothetical protein